MEKVSYQENESVLFIRAAGHITAGICPALKTRVSTRIEQMPEIRGIVVDLSACTYMDSTFMGLLVNFNKNLMKRAGKRIVVYHANEDCSGLLRTLGIDKLVDLSRERVPFPADMQSIDLGDEMSASLLLKAHEELMDISEHNRKRFAALCDILKKQTERENE